MIYEKNLSLVSLALELEKHLTAMLLMLLEEWRTTAF